MMALCLTDGCSLIEGHPGSHEPLPTAAWAFLASKDKDKLSKAGFATPRGGAKGAYQNHVSRSNKVIVPFERLHHAPLDQYESGYVIRLFPEQYFESSGQPKPQFAEAGMPSPGGNAFVLYRTHHQLLQFPPPADWRIRSLTLNGASIGQRVAGALDQGEYVLRISAHGAQPARNEGAPQGIFAPEYANEVSNYISKCVLAWLTINTVDSPYVSSQADHLELILRHHGVFDPAKWEALGLVRAGFTCCPLCLKLIRYSELHDRISFSEENSLMNAAEQVENSTRSTIVNLFHMVPLVYSTIEHVPANVAWGHANCNTKLGQRICHPLPELISQNRKVGHVHEDGSVTTFGWASENLELIRSPAGAVWIKIVQDHLSGEDQSTYLEYLTLFTSSHEHPV